MVYFGMTIKDKKPQGRIQSADITAGNRTCQVDCGGLGGPDTVGQSDLHVDRVADAA